MNWKLYLPIALLGILALATGCQSTASISYQPSYSTSYDAISKIPIAIKAVSDSRSLQPAIYYKNSRNGDTGQFDRPVAEVVRDAIAAELQKAGHTLSNKGDSSIILNCEVLDLEATMSEPPFQSPVLDMEVVLRFDWTDARTSRILATDERSERRSRKLGFAHTVKLPFDNAVVQGYGVEMVNDMLPRVIEKEIELSLFLRGNPIRVAGSSPEKRDDTASAPARSAALLGTAKYTIDIEVEFNSEITQGQSRVMVELRRGVPGASTVFDTKYFEGPRATVNFWNIPAGSYFLAIGNSDSVAVGPVHQFTNGQTRHSRLRVTQASGNIGTRSRSGL